MKNFSSSYCHKDTSWRRSKAGSLCTPVTSCFWLLISALSSFLFKVISPKNRSKCVHPSWAIVPNRTSSPPTYNNSSVGSIELPFKPVSVYTIFSSVVGIAKSITLQVVVESMEVLSIEYILTIQSYGHGLLISYQNYCLLNCQQLPPIIIDT